MPLRIQYWYKSTNITGTKVLKSTNTEAFEALSDAFLDTTKGFRVKVEGLGFRLTRSWR
jgi:hypothetical protein